MKKATKNAGPATRVELARVRLRTAREPRGSDPSSGSRQWFPRWDLADALEAVGDFGGAIEEIRRALRMRMPADARSLVRRELAHLLEKRGDLGRAEAIYRRLLAKAQGTGACISLGSVLSQRGRIAEAKQMHRRAIRLGDGCVDEAYANLASLLRVEGRYRQAIEAADHALRINPADELALHTRGDAERALTSRPDRERVTRQERWRRLLSEWEGDFYACALKRARDWVRRDPDDVGGTLTLALVLATMRRYDEALGALRGIRTGEPRATRAVNHAIGDLFAERGDNARAERHLRRACEHDAKPLFFMTLGDFYAKRGRHSEARRSYRRALRRAENASEASEAWGALGRSYRAKRSYPRAIEAFEQAMKLARDKRWRRCRDDCAKAQSIRSKAPRSERG